MAGADDAAGTLARLQAESWLAWAVVLKLGELGIDSTLVVLLRVNRLAAGVGFPGAMPLAEMQRMIVEKPVAAIEAARSVMAALAGTRPAFADADAHADQCNLGAAGPSAAMPARGWAQWPAIAGRVVLCGLHPIHAAARANARRLAHAGAAPRLSGPGTAGESP